MQVKEQPLDNCVSVLEHGYCILVALNTLETRHVRSLVIHLRHDPRDVSVHLPLYFVPAFWLLQFDSLYQSTSDPLERLFRYALRASLAWRTNSGGHTAVSAKMASGVVRLGSRLLTCRR